MMKSLRLARTILLTLTLILLGLNSVGGQARRAMVAAHAIEQAQVDLASWSMVVMDSEKHCSGCPSGAMVGKTFSCDKCSQWVDYALMLPMRAPLSRSPYLTQVQLPIWTPLSAPPWKPPRAIVLNG